MVESTTTSTSHIQTSLTVVSIATATLEEVLLDVQRWTGPKITVVASKPRLGTMMLREVTMAVMAVMVVSLVDPSNVQRNILQMVPMSISPSVAIMPMGMVRQVRCNPKVLSFIHPSGWVGFQEIVAAMATLTNLFTLCRTFDSRHVLSKVRNQGVVQSCQLMFRCELVELLPGYSASVIFPDVRASYPFEAAFFGMPDHDPESVIL
jgi:hypothetical protein